MSIRTQILLPLLCFLALGALVSGYIGTRSLSNHDALAVLVNKAIDASDASRGARDRFDDIEKLSHQVLEMTDFVEPAKIEADFKTASADAAIQLEALKTAAASDKMRELAQEAIYHFSRWKSDCEVLLGIRASNQIATMDAINEQSQSIRGILNQAMILAGGDARHGIAEAGSVMHTELLAVFGLASLIALAGVGGAFWLSNNFAHPLKQLVKNAEKLAAGDVFVELGALERKDEVGDIARPVETFRGNVKAQMQSQIEADEQRRISNEDRLRHENISKSAAAEQSVVVTAIAGALAKLAKSDLTCTVANFPVAYQQLETDFNAAIIQLRLAMEAVARSSFNMQNSSVEVSSATADLSHQTEQQAQRLDATATALDEIMATVRRTAEGANYANGIVSKAKIEAENSGVVVRDAITAVGRIEHSSSQIGQIISVIDEIAIQTNLLALNAGVEATRAGNAGLGFAVVASEVRALAQRSADAAKEIKALVSTSSSQVRAGVDLVGQTGESLTRILKQVSNIDTIVKEIVISSGEQAVRLDDVNTSVNQLGKATQRNAAQVEDSANASHLLAEEAYQLANLITAFKIENQTGAEEKQSRFANAA